MILASKKRGEQNVHQSKRVEKVIHKREIVFA